MESLFFPWYEAFERMAFYGIASNLVVYLTTQLHEDNVSSVRNVNNWSGYLDYALLWSLCADLLGYFWTFTISSLIYVMGMVLLTMAVSIKLLKPSCENGHLCWCFTLIGLVYIQENLSRGLGCGIPTVGLIFSLIIFYIGTPTYRHKVRKSQHPAKDRRVPIVAFANRKGEL
ncbi:hypothetical protein HAX54_025663 [Datura stramonium]|uniref:Uncharacterized protein n=1 Tax=Datura stramonium TaxID=4076 RepID=A0ABS8S6F0_DATST|nr:hypothetical protein [Datura stramonium]